ncbi:uncharacterized protein G2W53_042669 [Senna tora]|uniref:Uncharacterized protein n=1 Tax=Senna tora TaxID=362788 RepID=A0A834SGC0_9FABA|nr:uncharacterized protein G2W53_042669 [Senna tora]
MTCGNPSTGYRQHYQVQRIIAEEFEGGFHSQQGMLVVSLRSRISLACPAKSSALQIASARCGACNGGVLDFQLIWRVFGDLIPEICNV